MEAAATDRPESGRTDGAASSFSKSLLLGEIPEQMAFPWPEPRDDRIRALIAAAHEIGDALDHGEIEERRWIGDRVIRRLGDAGLCGLYVPDR